MGRQGDDEDEMGKDYTIYQPEGNPTNIIKKYNEALSEWNRRRGV